MFRPCAAGVSHILTGMLGFRDRGGLGEPKSKEGIQEKSIQVGAFVVIGGYTLPHPPVTQTASFVVLVSLGPAPTASPGSS